MKTTIEFTKCIVGCQEYGGTEQSLTSRVFFNVVEGGHRTEGVSVDVKQVVGSDYESSPIEVGKPKGSPGKLNHQAFQRAVEAYYRKLIGANANVLRISGTATVVNCEFDMKQTIEIEAAGKDAGW